MSQALYYPWIDVRDEAWLKSSLLYWETVRTIVPVSIDAPYSTETGRVLQDRGLLVPLRVHSGMEEIEELAGEVLTYLGTSEGAELLAVSHGGWRRNIHSEKFWRSIGLHPEKLPYEIRDHLRALLGPSERGSE